MQHAAVPVASAVHLLRPATASECLAAQVLSRNSTPLEVTPMDSTAGQQSFIESRPERLEKPQLAVPAARVPDPPKPAGFAEVELDSVSDQDQETSALEPVEDISEEMDDQPNLQGMKRQVS